MKRDDTGSNFAVVVAVGARSRLLLQLGVCGCPLAGQEIGFEPMTEA